MGIVEVEKFSPTTSEYLSSTSLSSVAQRVSDNQDFEWKEGM